MATWAVLLGASAFTVNEFQSNWAGQGCADTRAAFLVPSLTGLTRTNFALKLTGLAVPGLFCRPGAHWRWKTDAFAVFAVPDLVISALMMLVALATAGVEIPGVVVAQALAFYADALSGKNIPFFKFVVAILHLVATRTVEVVVTDFSVDKLAKRAHNQVIFVITAG